MKARSLALSLTLAAACSALPAQAQTGMEAFNPMTYLAPIMTPFGMMLAPMTGPAGANAFNPAAMLNPANMPNPAALMPVMPGMTGMPAMPAMPAMPNMQPFSGLQMSPQAYGMPPQMANPYAGMMPFAFPSAPAASPFPAFPGFPGFPGFPFPPAR